MRYNTALLPEMTGARYSRWYATRGRRRGIAATFVVSVVAWLTLILLDDLGSPLLGLLPSALLLPIILGISLTNLATQGWGQLTSDVLDERQLDEKRRSTITAHRISALLIAVVVPLAAVLAANGVGDGWSLAAATVYVVVLHGMLPRLVWMWTARVRVDELS